MAIHDTDVMGLDHPTVVPENFPAMESETGESSGDDREEPSVPRHR